MNKNKNNAQKSTELNKEECTEKDIEEVGANPEETEEQVSCCQDDLQQKLDEVNDKLLRKAAEFENFRKRTTKEKTENFSLGACDAAMKFIPILDNLDRAIAAETNEQSSFIDGVKMIRTQFYDALVSIGVSEIEAVGKEFDPEKHEAVMMEDSDLESNTVIEEFAKGYMYKCGDFEKIIRHSMVKVSN